MHFREIILFDVIIKEINIKYIVTKKSYKFDTYLQDVNILCIICTTTIYSVKLLITSAKFFCCSS